jgi:hypothetical protein
LRNKFIQWLAYISRVNGTRRQYEDQPQILDKFSDLKPADHWWWYG